MNDCIFCRIARGEIPAQMVHTDEDVVAFRDLNPQAPTHVLVIPRRHLTSVATATPEDAELLGRTLLAAAKIARDQGVEESGYRLVTNSGADAGQSVFHLHVHVLGGRRFAWPPG